MHLVDIITQVHRIEDLIKFSIPTVTGIRNQEKVKKVFNNNEFELEFKTHSPEFEVTYTLTFFDGVANIKPKLKGVKKLVDYYAQAETVFLELDLQSNEYNCNQIINTELVYNLIYSSLLSISINDCIESIKKNIKEVMYYENKY